MAAKPTHTEDSAAVEYLYGNGWRPHRIIKKTAKRVFILTDYTEQFFTPEKFAEHPEDFSTISLDRQKLERDGEIWHRPKHSAGGFYYTEEGMRRYKEEQAEREAQWRQQRAARGYTNGGGGQDGRASCFAILGLSFECTQKDVKRAFRRKSREAHPDNGGSHEAFIELRQAYEQALQLCG